NPTRARSGLACRYRPSSAERGPVAGIPPTQTCMNCHAQIWLQSDFLEPVRVSFRTNESIPWIKVHDLPDFVYFDHSIHVHKGIGCVSCHGRVDEMNQVWQASSLQMEWCLEGHRHPERHVRPLARVFDMAWTPSGDQEALGRQLVRQLDVHPRVDCDTCHR